MGDMEEKVDILMATYNPKIEYLKLQLDSILGQSYGNLRLIISDDKSTDEDVRRVLEEYSNKDERVEFYVQDENLGYIKNFEFLLGKSEAEYIGFADHDDIWYENKVEESLKQLKEHKVDLVYTDAKQIDENGNILQESYLDYKNMPKISGKNDIIAFSRHIAIGCSQLFTKNVKEKMLPYTGNVMAHDWVSVYVASKENGVFCIEKPLFGYRLHGTNVFGGRNFKQNLKIWKEKEGNSFASYMRYREKSIKDAYLSGAEMCCDYEKDKRTDEEKEVIKYYEEISKTKILNLSVNKFNKYLSFKNIGKRKMKEIILFHFPIIGFLVFKIA